MVARPTAQGQRDIAPVAEGALHPAQLGFQALVRVIRQEDQQEPVAGGCQVGPRDVAATLACAALSQGQQAAEATVTGTIKRVGQDGQAIAKIQPAAHHETNTQLCRPRVSAGDAGERVVVGDGEGVEPEHLSLKQQLLNPAGAA